jgi:hypothetical protein
VSPVRYGLNLYILFRRNSAFKGLVSVPQYATLLCVAFQMVHSVLTYSTFVPRSRPCFTVLTVLR